MTGSREEPEMWVIIVSLFVMLLEGPSNEVLIMVTYNDGKVAGELL